MNQDIKAVIFDMDGLLIDSEPFWQRAQAAAFRTVDLELSQQDLDSNTGKRIDENVARWYDHQPWDGVSLQEVEDRIVDEVIRLIKEEGELHAGVAEALEFFSRQDMPLAIASSSPMKIINAVVDSFNIRDRFVELFSAENESHGKPHPGVFITTAEHLGVQPQGCLVFEDSPSGVLAAKAAQMKCIAVPEGDNAGHRFMHTADIVLGSLAEFNQSTIDKITG